MLKSTLALIILILFLVGLVILQIFFSKTRNKWIGLILPFVFVTISIIKVKGAFIGNISISQIVIQVIIILSFCNIPTILLIAIYFAFRKKLKKNKEMNKMNIQDLH